VLCEELSYGASVGHRNRCALEASHLENLLTEGRNCRYPAGSTIGDSPLALVEARELVSAKEKAKSLDWHTSILRSLPLTFSSPKTAKGFFKMRC
jgi:hypothetical protein